MKKLHWMNMAPLDCEVEEIQSAHRLALPGSFPPRDRVRSLATARDPIFTLTGGSPMRFLVVTRGSHPPPPAPEMVDAMKHWMDRHLESGKMEQIWSFAGVRGGGAILDVESLEELDEVMTGFPFAPFSEVEIYPLTDLHQSLDRVRGQLESMAGG